MTDERQLREANDRQRASVFGRRVEEPTGGGQGGSMTVREANDVTRAVAFGRPVDADRLAEARSVLAAGVMEEPAGTPIVEGGRAGRTSDVLERVTSSPGGRTPGFTVDLDRRMDAAFGALQGLAESRLGFTHDQAEGHARRAFLEIQHATAAAQESRARFVQRLEQRVDAYRAVQALGPA